MILIILGAAWVAGILFGSFLRIPSLMVVSGIIPLFLLLVLPKRRKAIILSSLSIFAFFGGSIRFTASMPPDNNTQVEYFNGSVMNFRGIVDRGPDLRDKGTQLEIAVDSVQESGTSRPIKGKALLFIPGFTGYRYGDILNIRGKLESPPQLGDFDYRGYLAAQGIYSIVNYPAIDLVERDRGNPVMAWIYSVRENLSLTLARILPEPQASLAQGILLGMRGNISQDLKDDFMRSGTTHILAISGQNLSIVGGILISIFVWLLGRRHYLYIWLAMAIIWVYTLMTGASAPVIRSAVMTTLFLLAEFAGRQRSAGPALAFAAAVMIGISPPVLFDVSFQLSFLSMAGLVYISPPIIELGRRSVASVLGENGIIASGAKTIVDSFCVTLAALLAIWPLLAYYFNIVSLVAPLSTLLAVPSLTGIIVLSALSGGLGMLFLPLGQVFGWAAWLFLSYLLLVVKISAVIPASFFKLNVISPVLIAVYYALLIFILWTISHRKLVRSGWSLLITYLARFVTGSKIRWLLVPLLIAAILVAVTVCVIPDSKVHVDFLDVGQGDAILVRNGSQQVLIDGGPSSQAIMKQLGARMPFWDRNIELVVLTHPDADHMTGLIEVLRRFRVNKVVYPEYNTYTQLYSQWKQLLITNNVETTIAGAGQKFELGNSLMLEVLNPPIQERFEDGSDNNSIVTRLVYGKFSFLLTGDIYTPAENFLITERADLRSTVLKVAHHGSNNSTSDGFLNAVYPAAAVISVGKDNDYGHPAADTLARLNKAVSSSQIYRTDENGTVEFTSDGIRLWVTTEK